MTWNIILVSVALGLVGVVFLGFLALTWLVVRWMGP